MTADSKTPTADEVCREALKVFRHGDGLSRECTAGVIEAIMSGECSPALVGALLFGLAQKGETVDEIVGAATAMRRAATPVPCTRTGIVDTCGTGGSGIARVNVSSAAALVTAACGVGVAKHGNRAATSRSGSADVLEALGVDIMASPETVAQCIDELGVGFLFARSLHPAAKHAAPIRSQLGVRTIFNLLGPLTNPAGARRQVMGVFDPKWCAPLAQALVELGSERVFIVHGLSSRPSAQPGVTLGIDDISPDGVTVVAEGLAGRPQPACFELRPSDFGLPEHDLAELAGGDPAQNAAAMQRMFEGEAGAYRDAVLQATAMALLVAGEGSIATLPALVERAAHAIDDGTARKLLERLVATSRGTNEPGANAPRG